MCGVFVGLDSKLYKMHGTNIKILQEMSKNIQSKDVTFSMACDHKLTLH